MAAIGIRYYKLLNAGIYCIIWPQLRKEGNPGETVWDGREKDESKFRLYINTSITVDLSTTGISTGTKFFLSENTLFGSDRWGGIHDGSLDNGDC
ncbi:hypothetical protein H9Q72_005782 [Fusarium xylarioides]|uniref:Uncharacterized protein n=1 Tax=Fusarium xylarioides TaxID=221167 RepID=A0A9P7HUA2_9HYPO|nr:hypothetical protein H9Q70_009365 [Fusarium xylarioides]KAG5766164.1 hypothetical protein H9Q72_005782 [Fusarium xylarioides]